VTERRGALAGLVAGVLLLVVVVAFAVVLPRIDAAPESSDDAAADAPSGSVELPDALPDGLVAQDSGRLPTPPGADAAQFQEQLRDFQANAVDGFTDLFGVGAAFRVYASEDGAKQALVTVLDTPPGLFAPDGPPVDPELAGVARPATQLVSAGGAVCALNWGQPVPEGQPVPDGDPLLTRCQLGSGGRTFEMAGSGMAVEEIVSTLRTIVDRSTT